MGLRKVWPDLENYLRSVFDGSRSLILRQFFLPKGFGSQIRCFFSSFGLQESHFAEFMGTA